MLLSVVFKEDENVIVALTFFVHCYCTPNVRLLSYWEKYGYPCMFTVF